MPNSPGRQLSWLEHHPDTARLQVQSAKSVGQQIDVSLSLPLPNSSVLNQYIKKQMQDNCPLCIHTLNQAGVPILCKFPRVFENKVLAQGLADSDSYDTPWISGPTQCGSKGGKVPHLEQSFCSAELPE